MKYRMYIDEVGNPDLASSENPLHRFLSLTGVIIDLNYVSCILYPEMEQLKSDYFDSHPDDPVIFHRKELLNAKHPFEVLRDSETRSRFDEDLLDRPLPPFGTKVIEILQRKYYQHQEKIFGKKFI